MIIPPIYRSIGPVQGLPLNWRDEVTGALPAAVTAYLDNRIEGKQIDEAQLRLVQAFMDHYICAPCWNHMLAEDEEMATILIGLRRDVQTIKTPEEMTAWLERCLNIGIDPL